MPVPQLQVCEFKTYKAIFTPTPRTLTCDDLLAHTSARTKDGVPLFAPVTLGPVPQNGCKHARARAQRPHRCDASVTSVTALVFDADQGTDEDINALHDRLNDAAVQHVLYSTFSYDPAAEKQAYRLVVFIDRPIKPEEFKAVRANAITRFKVPCDPSSSAGLSHSYYMPASQTGTSRTLVYKGNAGPLRVDDFVGELAPVTEALAFVDIDSPKHVPPQSALRKECERYIQRRPDTKEARILRAALDGMPLASQGGRHAAVIILRGVLCGLFTDVDPGCLYELVAPSLDAMNVGEAPRDFALEFADEIEIYQDGLFGKDAARIAEMKPKGFIWPKLPDYSGVREQVVREVREVFSARVREFTQTGDGRLSLSRAIATASSIPQEDLNRAVWTLLATAKHYPLETYVAVLAPCAALTTVGRNRLVQLIEEAAYSIAAARQKEDAEFEAWNRR